MIGVAVSNGGSVLMCGGGGGRGKGGLKEKVVVIEVLIAVVVWDGNVTVASTVGGKASGTKYTVAVVRANATVTDTAVTGVAVKVNWR